MKRDTRKGEKKGKTRLNSWEAWKHYTRQIQPLKMIERDMFWRRAKASKIKQFSLWSWRWIWKEVQWDEKYIGTIVLPLLGWLISEFSASPFWPYVFCGFSEIRSIFKSRVLQNPGAPPKKQSSRAHFLIWCVNFGVGNPKTPFSHSSVHSSLPQRKPMSHPLRPRQRTRTAKTKNPFSRASFWEGWRKRTPFCAPAAITGAQLHPTKHCKNRVFWHRMLRAPFLNAYPGSFPNEWKGKKHPIFADCYQPIL